MSAPGDGIDWLEMGYEHGYKGGTTPRVFPNRIAEEKYWDGYDNGSEAYEYEHEFDEHDGQPDEAQEWHDYDPDC
jgi:hypothetical protein